MHRNIITRAVWIVSFISLFTDIASEMLYPVMPIYLRNIGFTVVLIGTLEGMAEATAGISKGYFGNLSDMIRKRVVFIRSGYSLSAFSKPMMGILTAPVWIFTARTMDRLGKGIRTSARDALLSEETTAENKGRIFGFHRGMDTLGAAIGPCLALLYLHRYPGQYALLFILAFLPGLVAVLLSFTLKEKIRINESFNQEKPGFFHFLKYWKKASPNYRMLVIGLLVFTLFNSSDAFLLLLLKDKGLSDTTVIGFYILYNVAYALLSYPVGILADKIGLKVMLVVGLTVFVTVYGSIGFVQSVIIIGGIFLLYALYAAATEGVTKALITNISGKKDTATAIGFYNGFASIFALISSTFAGFIWYAFSPRVMFLVSAMGVFCVVVFFVVVFKKKPYK
jgi:MFS family permease